MSLGATLRKAGLPVFARDPQRCSCSVRLSVNPASALCRDPYDGEPVYQAIAGLQPDPPPDVVIPPRASAVTSTEDVEAQSRRDRHIRLIAGKGRMAWQRATGYGRRSLAETAVGRYKGIIGSKLRARILPAQQGEAAVAAEVLNRMIRVAKPVSTRVA